MSGIPQNRIQDLSVIHFGKPRIYLDHNILDHLTKKEWSDELIAWFRDNAQVVYSSATLKEIARSPEYADSFLSVLSSMNAKYIEPILDDKNAITNNFRIVDTSPNEVFKMELKQAEELTLNGMEELLHKMMGGKIGESIGDIVNDLKDELCSLLKNLKPDIPDVKNGIDNVIPMIGGALGELKRSFNHAIPDSVNYNGRQDFRDNIDSKPLVINNYDSSEIILEVERLLQKKGIGLADFTHSGLSLYQNVCSLYMLFEMAGYGPEKNIEEDRRFTAFMSDMYHVANAICCNAILTRDRRLVKKASAVYAYLNINTNVVYFQD